MRNLLVVAVLLALFTCVSSTAFANHTVGDLEFGDSFQTLLQNAQKSEKSLVVDFYTDWCYWCKVMDDSTYPDPYVQKFLKNFELGMVNAEVDTSLAARYGVRSYPTILLLKPNGDEIDRIVGYYPPEEFVTQIVNAYAGVGTLDYYLAKLQDDPESAQANYDVAQKYRWQGHYDKAQDYFKKVMSLDGGNAAGLAAQADFNLGHMQYKLKNYLAAIEVWRQMSRDFASAPESVDAELMTAYCYQEAKLYKQAREAYDNFLKKYPDTEEKDWINEQLAKMTEEANASH